MANPHPTPFKKTGAAANPNGRPPKAWTMSTLIEEALEEVEAESGKSYKSLVAKRLADMAVGGDIQAIKEINDRIDGKPRQPIEMSGTIQQNVVRTPAKRDLGTPPQTNDDMKEK